MRFPSICRRACHPLPCLLTPPGVIGNAVFLFSLLAQFKYIVVTFKCDGFTHARTSQRWSRTRPRSGRNPFTRKNETRCAEYCGPECLVLHLPYPCANLPPVHIQHPFAPFLFTFSQNLSICSSVNSICHKLLGTTRLAEGSP